MFFFRQSQKSGLSPQEAIAGAKAGELVVIDVRDRGELAMTGKAEGALHLPLMRLRDMADPRHPDFCGGIGPDTRIACYCASGGRSGQAVMILKQLGYEDAHNIGGLGHWVQAGGKVEKA